MTIEKLPSGMYRVGARVFDNPDDAIAFDAGRAQGERAPPTFNPTLSQDQPKAKNASKWWLIILVPILVVCVLAVVGAFVKPSQADLNAERDRGAIQLCWKDYERRSLDAATKRFVASTCEKMEESFTATYRRSPRTNPMG